MDRLISILYGTCSVLITCWCSLKLKTTYFTLLYLKIYSHGTRLTINLPIGSLLLLFSNINFDFKFFRKINYRENIIFPLRLEHTDIQKKLKNSLERHHFIMTSGCWYSLKTFPNGISLSLLPIYLFTISGMVTLTL